MLPIKRFFSEMDFLGMALTLDRGPGQVSALAYDLVPLLSLSDLHEIETALSEIETGLPEIKTRVSNQDFVF